MSSFSICVNEINADNLVLSTVKAVAAVFQIINTIHLNYKSFTV